MQCGCLYWHEWFSHKPCCQDPCNCCGEYTASRNPYVVTGPRYTRFGEVYSDGSGSNAPGAIGEMYSRPGSGQPTPAQPEGLLDEEGGQGPSPQDRMREELPGPTTHWQGQRRTASNHGMPQYGPHGGYGSPQAYGQQGYGPVDYPHPSRTLGGASRTRLFTR